jgi:hypothetical protein
MSDTYQCYKCKGITIDPDCELQYEPYEFWGEYGMQTFNVYKCSYCGSDDMEPYEEPDDEECAV